jgi:predicted RNA-binding protein associated with RNAse of E/G family
VAVFSAGETIVVRDMIFGKPFTAWPHRVIEDTGYQLAVLLQPGTQGVGPSLWIQSFRDSDPEARHALLPAVASRDWQLGEWTWQKTTRLALLYPDRYFAVDPMWDENGNLLCWYINFQMPYQRTTIGVDTRDLILDMIVSPDLSYQWKDQDEYQHARHLGIISDQCHRHLDEAREQAVAMVEQQTGPFAEPWATWRPDPTWPPPQLPSNALKEPAAPQLHGLSH